MFLLSYSYLLLFITMIDYIQLLLLGGFAGFTIFLGIPLALLPARNKMKGFLNSIAIGILIFILFDVLEVAWVYGFEPAWENLTNATYGSVLLTTMFFGIAIGLIGLAFYQEKFKSKKPKNNNLISENFVNSQMVNISSTKLSLMIAIGIGVHNLSEGLVIGQSYAQNNINLAVILIIGFGAHNATEGFGIIGPLVGNKEKPSIGYLVSLGLIGGGPTFIGTILGTIFVSEIANIFFLSLAAGALIYVILLMNSSTGKSLKIPLAMAGIFIGLVAGFLTDLLITIGGV